MAKYRLNVPKIFGDTADGEAIIINSASGMYYGMNAYGTRLYENLVAGVDDGDLRAAAAALADAPAEAGARVDEFTRQLLQYEILSPDAGATAAPSLDGAEAAAAGFKPIITEYADAQEMLLADPIHAVREDRGWAPDRKVRDADEEAVRKKEEKIAW